MIASLAEVFASMPSTVVALSGGVDSTLLAYVATHIAHTVPSAGGIANEQKRSSIAVTATSPSLASGELELCERFCELHNIDWQSVATEELDDDRYLVNGFDRCFWCKDALMDQLIPIAQSRSATIVLGVNCDDLADHRPGQEAAAARGARFPFVEAGLSKADVRNLALYFELDTWDRPAMPCLASRIPYGTAVTVSLLSRIDRAEAAIRGLGFSDVRVRDYEKTARIELPQEEMSRAVEVADEITAAVIGSGYEYATLDLAGLRSGNLNSGLNEVTGAGSAQRLKPETETEPPMDTTTLSGEAVSS